MGQLDETKLVFTAVYVDDLSTMAEAGSFAGPTNSLDDILDAVPEINKPALIMCHYPSGGPNFGSEYICIWSRTTEEWIEYDDIPF